VEEKGVIGIPRALMFYRYFPLWRSFFEELGWKVLTSEELGKRGRLIYFEDSCLPMKLLVTHSLSLKERVDFLFIPRLVSLDRDYIMCPKFRGAPDIARLAVEDSPPILDETIDLRTKGFSWEDAFLRIGKRLGAQRKEIQKAIKKAWSFYFNFMKGWEERVNTLPLNQLWEFETPPGPAKRKEEQSYHVALVGHPYNLYDRDISKDLLSFIRKLGMRITTSDSLSKKEWEQEVSGLSKEIYWSSGREMVGSLFHFLSSSLDGVIFLTSFKCGIDALLQEFVKRRLKVVEKSEKPLLILTLDEHSGREGLMTRLEAFRDVLEQKKTPNPIHEGRNPLTDG